MPKTLLLADDSVTIQKVVGLSFASEDVVLVTVSNGDDAVVRVREIRPDLVLADVVMPGKNGYEVCEAVKNDPALRHIPVLLLTGTFEAFDQERARRAGADGHVTKPFEAQALVHQVKDLMARSAPPAPAFKASPPAQAFESFDLPLLRPMPDAGAPAAAPKLPAPTPADDSFFASELAPASSLGVDPLGFDFDAVDRDLELAAVAEEETRDEDLLGAIDLATLGAPATSPATPTSPAFDPAEESFRGSPLFAPEVTGSDAYSPRAVAPAPVNVRPDDGFDLGAEEDLAALVPPRTKTAVAPPAPVNLFGDDDLAADHGLEPGHAEGYDISFADLDDPLAVTRGEAARPAVFAPDPPRAHAPLDTTPQSAWTSYDPQPTPTLPSYDPQPTPTLPSYDPQPAPTLSSYDPQPAPTLSSYDPQPTPTLPSYGTQPTPTLPEPPRAVVPEIAPLRDERPATTRPAEPEAGRGVDLSPVMRQRLHDTLEKVAWEAFADLSDTIVRQTLERVERIAWEVIPQMAEQLIREEIRRIKGDPEGS